jgi:DNA-binding MarR family transcriptional regulator
MDVQTVINKMVEENLSIFRYAMDSLPKLQQQVLSGIALNSNAATSIIIRELTGLESSSISASLLRLEKKGLIVRIGEVKRNASYSVKDRLLAYWLKKTLSE